MGLRRIAAAVAFAMLSGLLVAPAAVAVTPVEGVESALELTGLDALTDAINGLAHREIELAASSIDDRSKRKRFVDVLREQFSGDTLSRLIETTLLNGYDADVYETVIDRFGSKEAQQMQSLNAECQKLKAGDAPLQVWQSLGHDGARRAALLKLADDSRAAAITDAAIVTLQQLTESVRSALLGDTGNRAAVDMVTPAVIRERVAWLARRDAAWMAWCYRDVGADGLARFDDLYRSDATAKLLEAYRRALTEALSRIGRRTTDRLNF